MKKIAVYTRNHYDNRENLIRLIRFLEQKGIRLVLEHNLAGELKKHISFAQTPILFKGYKDLPKDADLFISYGGDGTILRSAIIVRDSGIPVLGINAGRLGFLAQIPEEKAVDALEKFLEGRYVLQPRSLLQARTIPDKGKPGEMNFALNEITVTRKNSTSMIKVAAYIDEEFLSYYWADGLIIATPTGSTGYSLSCGGPIVHPDTKTFIINAIAPHNLTVRPLIIPDKHVINLKPEGREREFLLSLDSRVMSLPFSTEIEIRKAPFHINFVQIEGYTFIQTLRKKLFWGFDNRNQ